MESPPASQRVTVDRSLDVRDSVCNGIRLDGEWKYRHLCEDTSKCKLDRAGKRFIESLAVFAASS